MKELFFLVQLLILTLIISHGPTQGQRPPLFLQRRQPPPPKVICTADSLMVYQDCRICVCPRPHRAAKCFRKSCDLRTKDSGQCPSTFLKLDENKLCPGAPTPTCRTDTDCPEKLVCCFDFCKGSQCINPVPLDPGVTTHRGRGFA